MHFYQTSSYLKEDKTCSFDIFVQIQKKQPHKANQTSDLKQLKFWQDWFPFDHTVLLQRQCSRNAQYG